MVLIPFRTNKAAQGAGQPRTQATNSVGGGSVLRIEAPNAEPVYIVNDVRLGWRVLNKTEAEGDYQFEGLKEAPISAFTDLVNAMGFPIERSMDRLLAMQLAADFLSGVGWKEGDAYSEEAGTTPLLKYLRDPNMQEQLNTETVEEQEEMKEVEEAEGMMPDAQIEETIIDVDLSNAADHNSVVEVEEEGETAINI
jgi:hypothetical protein